MAPGGWSDRSPPPRPSWTSPTYLFTSDLERAMRLGAGIEAGMVAINRGRVSCVATPFGGVGHSGFGHSGGTEGIEEYRVTRYLTMPGAGGGW